MFKHFAKLYENDNRLALLEWSYLVLAVASLFTAGVLSLFNHDLGVSILIVPLLMFVAMVANVVVWSLIKLVADTFLPKKSEKKLKK